MWPTALPRRRQQRDTTTPREAAATTAVRLRLLAISCWLGLALNTAMDLVPAEVAITAVSAVAALCSWLRVLRVPTDRPAWAAFATGSSAYALGWVVLFFVTSGEGAGPGGLNLSDTVSLLLYPAWLSAVLVLGRRPGVLPARALLDGAIIAASIVAAGLAVSAQLLPEAFGRGWTAVVYAAAYPIGSAVLVATALTLAAVSRTVLTPARFLQLLAFVVMFTGQVLFAARAADGPVAFGGALDLVYLAGPVLVAVAAWQPAVPWERRAGTGTPLVLTTTSVLVALLVLVVPAAGTPVSATALAAVAVVGAVVRTALYVSREQALELRAEQALLDPLTGLPNRRALITELDRPSPTGRTLLLLDLDRFKGVNDSLGHGAGDEVLRETAARLLAGLPEGSVVARLGGDEFAVLLDAAPDGVTGARASALRGRLQQAFLVDGHALSLGASVGFTGAPVGATQPSAEVLRRADIALYEAKRNGQGVAGWRPGLDDGARDRLLLIAELRHALNDGAGLVVHLQPQCDPRSGEVRALEALVRWMHPDRGLLLPGDFLSAADAGGLLPQLTQRVLDLALGDVAVLRARGYELPVAVNMSAPDLLDTRFASRVAAALDRHGLPTSCLRLEVTETVVLRDPARIIRTLRLLAGIGVGLSLDDYGTGLASLTYLRDLPIDELKIDRSFITPYLSDATSRAITDSTLDLAHQLGLTVVAEGIEDQDTADALADAGCDLLQGWALGVPATREQLLLNLDAAAAAGRCTA